MAYILSDHTLTPVAEGSRANLEALLEGGSALSLHEGDEIGIPHPFMASLLEECDGEAGNLFERRIVHSIRQALADAGVDAGSERTLFVLSTTKGNVEALAANDDESEASIAHSAERIAAAVGFKTQPLVVCNACISGLSALIVASRLIGLGFYDHAVVSGTDVVRRFVVSGFHSLKALSEQPCRPFDIERNGLNLGEAVATIVLGNKPQGEGSWLLQTGAVRNDAYHISAPSKQADGQTCCLERLLKHIRPEEVDFVSVHGTATLFNDQMEAVALRRAGLLDVPVSALKGYYGHTLGAAGLLETAVSLRAAEEGRIPATRGFSEVGVSGNPKVSAEAQTVGRNAFIKTLSGFGGCNAAALFRRDGVAPLPYAHRELRLTHSVEIGPFCLTVDGSKQDFCADENADFLTLLYKEKIGGYAKFYKMDHLSRLGFVASELLLQAEGAERFTERDDRAVVLFNDSSSVDADRAFLKSVTSAEGYFPSPSVFVYTLPNIVTGEIAIRNGYKGETALYILAREDEQMIHRVLEATVADDSVGSVLAGWISYTDANNYSARLGIYETE